MAKNKKTSEKVSKKETSKGTCHECLKDFKYKELNSVRKDGGSMFYTYLLCNECCQELKVSGQNYAELLKDRRKHTSEILNLKKDE